MGKTNSPKSKLQETVTGIIGLLVIALVLIAILGGESQDTSLSTSDTPQAAENSPQQPESPGYKLAKLHAVSNGRQEPDKALVDSFEAILKKLDAKCTENDELRIADTVVTAQQKLKDKGVSMELPEVADGINGSIPDSSNNTVSCADVAAAFITLTITNKR